MDVDAAADEASASADTDGAGAGGGDQDPNPHSVTRSLWDEIRERAGLARNRYIL